MASTKNGLKVSPGNLLSETAGVIGGGGESIMSQGRTNSTTTTEQPSTETTSTNVNGTASPSRTGRSRKPERRHKSTNATSSISIKNDTIKTTKRPTVLPCAPSPPPRHRRSASYRTRGTSTTTTATTSNSSTSLGDHEIMKMIGGSHGFDGEEEKTEIEPPIEIMGASTFEQYYFPSSSLTTASSANTIEAQDRELIKLITERSKVEEITPAVMVVDDPIPRIVLEDKSQQTNENHNNHNNNTCSDNNDQSHSSVSSQQPQLQAVSFSSNDNSVSNLTSYVNDKLFTRKRSRRQRDPSYDSNSTASTGMGNY